MTRRKPVEKQDRRRKFKVMHFKTLRLEKSHYDAAVELADDLGQSFSEYVRRLIRTDLKKSGRLPAD